jgi:periplasmic protein CpxP/Spy
MNKVKILSFLCFSLVAINIFLIWFLLLHQPHQQKNFREKIIIEKLHFSDKQIAEYQQLIAKHRKDVAAAKNKMMSLKNTLYANLQQAEHASLKDSIIAQIRVVQSQIEQINYSHFKDIQHICIASQMPAFNALTLELANIFNPQKPQDEKR